MEDAASAFRQARGILVHRRSKIRRRSSTRVSICDQPSIKLIDYPPAGMDDGEELACSAAYASECAMSSGGDGEGVRRLKSILNKPLVDLDSAIALLRLVKLSSRILLPDLVAAYAAAAASSADSASSMTMKRQRVDYGLLNRLVRTGLMRHVRDQAGRRWLVRGHIRNWERLKPVSVSPPPPPPPPPSSSSVSSSSTSTMQSRRSRYVSWMEQVQSNEVGHYVRGVVHSSDVASGRFELRPSRAEIEYELYGMGAINELPIVPDRTYVVSCRGDCGCGGGDDDNDDDANNDDYHHHRQELAALASIVDVDTYRVYMLAQKEYRTVRGDQLSTLESAIESALQRKTLCLTAVGRVPHDGDAVTATVVGKIGGEVQVVVDDELLVAPRRLIVREGNADAEYVVRTVRCRDALYLASDDLPALRPRDTLQFRQFDSSKFACFYNGQPHDINSMTVTLPDMYRQLVAAHCNGLQSLRFIAADSLAKVLLAAEGQSDELIRELLLC